MLPRVEAGLEDRCPFQKHPPHHPGLPPQEGAQLAPGGPAVEPVLHQQPDRIVHPVTEIFAGDQQRDQRADLPALPRTPVAGCMQPDIVDQPLVLDLLGGVPPPDFGGDRVGAREIFGVGEQLAADDCGEMFERNGDRKIEFGRAPRGQREHLVDPAIDALNVVAVVLDQPVEGDMLARVINLLPGESLDLGGEPRREIVAKGLERVDEEGFAARQARAHRIVPGGGDRIVGMPPARCLVRSVKPLVADDQHMFRRRDAAAGDPDAIVGPRSVSALVVATTAF